MPGAKEKFPSLGSTPQELRHCDPSALNPGGNKFASWWDCKGCNHRIVDIKKSTGELNYYAVPPCSLSPSFDPLQPVPTISQARAEVVSSKAPPLCRKDAEKTPFQARTVKEPPSYTDEEEQVLARARQILKEKSEESAGKTAVPKPPPPPFPPMGPSSSTATQPKRTLEQEEPGMVYVDEVDLDLMRRIEAMEQATASMRMELAEKHYQQQQRPYRK